MKINLALAAMLFAVSVNAADGVNGWTDTPNPTPGKELSRPGTFIEVEGYRCTVKSERSLECVDIGRSCIKARESENAYWRRNFGCGNKCENPTAEEERESKIAMHCWPTIFGGW